MPIISEIGRRSPKVRFIYACIYLTLIVGAVSMVYPLLLMLAGSVKSEADSWSISPYPGFWFSDRILFQKYAESKYNTNTDIVQNAWGKRVLSWSDIEPPPAVALEFIEDCRNWRRTIPVEQRFVGQIKASGMLPENLRSYRSWMAEKYNNDLAAYNCAANQSGISWSDVRIPLENIGRYLNQNLPAGFRREISRWRETVRERDIIIRTSQGSYVFDYLCNLYTNQIKEYNQRHGTSYRSYSDIPWHDRVPAEAGLIREDWINYVRNRIELAKIRLDKSLKAPFQDFIRKRYASVKLFNRERRTNFEKLSSVPFPAKLDDASYLRRDFEAFIKSGKDCPIEAVSIDSEETQFRKFLIGKYGRVPENYPGLGTLIAAVDWQDCMANKGAVRWEFTKRNYVQVLDYIAMHGNGLMNTFIYCGLAIITALIVNPLAAYALSRFKLPGTYKILLFCMATMAFPGEVTMIPGFLLLKRFPLYPVVTGVSVTIILFLILERWRPAWKENCQALVSLLAGIVAGFVIVPFLAPELATTSLLNTFAALILPGAANGYSIFLLKGFFDSMPKELYEAADIDGAGEWTKFWTLTMTLSKPILAVIALGAFTSAYSAFMMALIIIPDQKMWTIMVWIFQLQTMAHQAVVYASLVIAAIPTFMIFAFCQNLIIWGIVVPTEK
ncbi:MAG: carbohydrate ABC transporter permease [Victivallaceae bacterium]|nr:carbohydrate ABC transporter permease [Victivallaceae bacterium]